MAEFSEPGDEGQGPGDEGQGPGPEPEPGKKSIIRSVALGLLIFFGSMLVFGLGSLAWDRFSKRPNLDSKIEAKVSDAIEALDIQGLVNKAAQNLGVLVKVSVDSRVTEAISAADIPGVVRNEVMNTLPGEEGLNIFNETLPAKVAAIGDRRWLNMGGPAHKELTQGLYDTNQRVGAAEDTLNGRMGTAEARLDDHDQQLAALKAALHGEVKPDLAAAMKVLSDRAKLRGKDRNENAKERQYIASIRDSFRATADTTAALPDTTQ